MPMAIQMLSWRKHLMTAYAGSWLRRLLAKSLTATAFPLQAKLRPYRWHRLRLPDSGQDLLAIASPAARLTLPAASLARPQPEALMIVGTSVSDWAGHPVAVLVGQSGILFPGPQSGHETICGSGRIYHATRL